MITEPAAPRRLTAIRTWLLVVAGLVVLTVLVGGATRLTGSGLSIVEWKPVTGIVPPMSEAAWSAEFEKYRQIPQYQQVNRGMSLAEFKTIYWWEWGHRVLGRLVGFAFLVPFLVFLWRRRIPPLLSRSLWVIFGLGAAQGALGWWMVRSGLSERVSVSQYRLAAHLILALVIFSAILFVVARLRQLEREAPEPTRVALGPALVLGLTFVQIYLGALVAGLDAGLTYNTWPLMDGRLIPPGSALWSIEPTWRNLFENVLTVQFLHRIGAYVLWAVALAHAWSAWRAGGAGARLAVWLAGLITLQAVIGIATLVHGVPISLGMLHQAIAIVILGVATWHLARSGPAAEPVPASPSLQGASPISRA